LLGDFDRSFDAEYYKEKQYPIEIIKAPDQKNRFGKAFDYLHARNIPAANVV
jgi:thiamine pyrophosphokinase